MFGHKNGKKLFPKDDILKGLVLSMNQSYSINYFIGVNKQEHVHI